MFEFVEEALDTIALLVELGVVGALKLAVALGRDDDLGAAFGDPIDKVVGVISLVSDSSIGVDTVDQVMGQGDVVALLGRGDQANWKAKGLGGGMDLGAQAAARLNRPGFSGGSNFQIGWSHDEQSN